VTIKCWAGRHYCPMAHCARIFSWKLSRL